MSKLREKYAEKKYCIRMIKFRENANFVIAFFILHIILIGRHVLLKDLAKHIFRRFTKAL